MNNYHTSVLLQETIANLQIKTGKQYIDATLGGGGHTKAIMHQGGIVLGLDTDQEALDHLTEECKVQSAKCKIAKGNFKHIDTIAKENGFEHVNGVLFDLGVSGHQLDTGKRGFSFQRQGVLDMRMDQAGQVTAADLVNGLGKDELFTLFTRYGEEPFARHIANAIVSVRKEAPIVTTKDLERVIWNAVPVKSAKSNPSTRVFQALRIAVNDELHSIEDALPKALSLLEAGGRIVVISFHSLEDRIVKNKFREFEKMQLGHTITDKPIVPTEEEITINARSRSAKLRVFEKN